MFEMVANVVNQLHKARILHAFGTFQYKAAFTPGLAYLPMISLTAS